MKNTAVTFKQAKEKNEKLTMLTAYDYSTAKIIDEAGINGILVGDSLGMVCLGYEDTLSVTMEDMIHHTKAVARGAKNTLVVADMPFMSYQTSVYDAVVNAGRLIKMTENYLNNMDKSHPDYIFYTKNLIMLEKLKEQQEKKLEAINHN